jgi:hypothetical protein
MSMKTPFIKRKVSLRNAPNPQRKIIHKTDKASLVQAKMEVTNQNKSVINASIAGSPSLPHKRL